MADNMNVYGDITPRTAAYAVPRLLDAGDAYMNIQRFATTEPLPPNKTDTAKFRRYENLPLAKTPLEEGVTPAGEQITYTDLTVKLDQYGSHVPLTDRIQDLHEDPVLNRYMKLVGRQAGETLESLRHDTLRAGSNVIYANGSSRSDVNTAISRPKLRQAVKVLLRQRAQLISQALRSDTRYNTVNVEPTFIAFCHTDLESSIRDLPGFKSVADFGSKPPYPNVLGALERTTFVLSQLYEPWKDDGGVAGGNYESTSGTSADVYPIVIVAMDSYGVVPLKGRTAVTPIVHNPKVSDTDKLGQRGHVGWKTYDSSLILNEGWAIRIEVAAPL